MYFSKKSKKAKQKAELLGLMAKDPYVKPRKLKDLKAKTLVLVGDKDLIRLSHSKLIARKLPNGELRVIPGDHWIAKSNPKVYNKVVKEFLKN